VPAPGQGIEYKAQGYENAQRWIDNSRGRLITGTANRLADELLSQGTIDWLRTALGEGKESPDAQNDPCLDQSRKA
jgi:putative hydrolase of HD superfamily